MNPTVGNIDDDRDRASVEQLDVHHGAEAAGRHTDVLSRNQGNDLITPRPEFDFPGLKPGDRWCLCAARWKVALDAGAAPPVVLLATQRKALEVVPLADLKAYAIDLA